MSDWAIWPISIAILAIAWVIHRHGEDYGRWREQRDTIARLKRQQQDQEREYRASNDHSHRQRL